MIDYKDFGRQIRIIRRKQGLTQEELAEQVGISASFLGHLERGSRIASLETLVALCNTLKTSPQQFLAASLDNDLAAHMPPDLTAEDRSKINHLLHLAQETINGWDD